MSLKLFMPTKVLIGKGCIKDNTAEFLNIGRRCIVVTGKSSAKKCGALDDLISVLTELNIQYVIFDEVQQNPMVSCCYKAGMVAIEQNVDFVIGIGGGSPLDAAKAVAVYAANPTLPQYGLFEGWQNMALPLILIGTTAGTGSEVTPYSVLTRDDTGFKGSFSGTDCYAKVAFGDPEYTSSMSKYFTISSALDSICHCFESFFVRTADYISQNFAIEGLKLGLRTLATIKDFNSITLQQRENLYTASIYGGLAINRTGTALCHLMSYPITENKGLAHGFACTLFLEEFIQRIAISDKQKFDNLLSELDIDFKTLVDTINSYLFDLEKISYSDEELASWVQRWSKQQSLGKTAIPLDENSLKEIAVSSLKTVTSSAAS